MTDVSSVWPSTVTYVEAQRSRHNKRTNNVETASEVNISYRDTLCEDASGPKTSMRLNDKNIGSQDQMSKIIARTINVTEKSNGVYNLLINF
jgi:hypothetical protein